MEHLSQILGVCAWFGAAIAAMNYLGKRKTRQDLDPVRERERAEKIAQALGGWVIWALLGAAFLLSLASGIWVFIGLATGDNYSMTAKMGGVLFISLPAYLFLERIMEALNRR